jgi:hypothetical protein
MLYQGQCNVLPLAVHCTAYSCTALLQYARCARASILDSAAAVSFRTESCCDRVKRRAHLPSSPPLPT